MAASNIRMEWDGGKVVVYMEGVSDDSRIYVEEDFVQALAKFVTKKAVLEERKRCAEITVACCDRMMRRKE